MGLAAALRDAGLAARVEADGRLALLGAPAARAEAVRLARAHGFTHAALVIDPGGEPAPP